MEVFGTEGNLIPGPLLGIVHAGMNAFHLPSAASEFKIARNQLSAISKTASDLLHRPTLTPT